MFAQKKDADYDACPGINEKQATLFAQKDCCSLLCVQFVVRVFSFHSKERNEVKAEALWVFIR